MNTVVQARQSGDDNVLVAAEDVNKTLGDHAVLTGVSVAVHRGEVVTVIGPNGAGKSTLLRILMGLMKPDGGRVRRRAGLVIGYVPQHVDLDPALPLTVGRLLGLTCRDSGRIRAALAEVGVHDGLAKPVHNLSGGELRRVLLARALLRAPDLLVLDEPLAGVDVAGQAELYRLIGRLRQHYHAGVLMVSHDLHLVMAETDRVVCLNHHVCCAGHPEAVSRDPAYAALFGTALDSAVAIYTHAHDHVHDETGHVVPLVDGEKAADDHHHDTPGEGDDTPREHHPHG